MVAHLEKIVTRASCFLARSGIALLSAVFCVFTDGLYAIYVPGIQSSTEAQAAGLRGGSQGADATAMTKLVFGPGLAFGSVRVADIDPEVTRKPRKSA